MRIRIFCAALCLVPWALFSESTSQLLVGIWQDSPVMASGWGEAYQFFPNGDFILNHSQMDCGRRERSVHGTWTLQGDNLVLKATKHRIVQGGKRVKATGSCASDYDIEGGTIMLEDLNPPQTTRWKISFPKPDADFSYSVIQLGKYRYWKMRADPKDYE